MAKERIKNAIKVVILWIAHIWCDKDGTPSCKRIMGSYILFRYAESLEIAATNGTNMPVGADIAAWVGCALIGLGTVTRMFKAIKGNNEEGS